MTAADQIAEMRRRASARYAAINRGRFARRLRPTKRGWRYATLLPRDGRQDMWRALAMAQRAPDESRGLWSQVQRKMTIDVYMRRRGKIRAWHDLPRCVKNRYESSTIR